MNKLLKTGIDESVKALIQYVKKKKGNATRKPKKQRQTSGSRVVSAPVARTKIMSQVQPKMSMASDRVLIKHRELVSGNVAMSSSFAIGQSLVLNPATSAVFPWLAPIASNYQYYSWKSLKFEYVPYVSTTTSGEIMMAIDYDAGENAPLTEVELSSYQGFKSTPAWKGEICALSQELATSFVKWHYCYNGYTGTDPNAQQYNAGVLYVASNNGIVAGTGKLYAHYEVELKNPTLPPVGVFGDPDGGRFQSVSGLTSVFPLGTLTSSSAGTQGMSVSASLPSSGNLLNVFNPGTYLLVINMSGTGLSSGLSMSLIAGGGSASNLSVNANAGGTGVTYVFNCNVTSAYSQFLITGSTNTTLTAGVLYAAETPILVS